MIVFGFAISLRYKNNPFLLASSRDLPYDVMLSDWKWSTVGSPTFDLATLMLSATPSKEFRDAYVKPLLQTYHRVFTGALSSRYGLEYPSFTCEDLVKDYEMSLHGAFLKVSRINYLCFSKEEESPKIVGFLNVAI